MERRSLWSGGGGASSDGAVREPGTATGVPLEKTGTPDGGNPKRKSWAPRLISLSGRGLEESLLPTFSVFNGRFLSNDGRRRSRQLCK